ncbi:MAG TPA: CapA family protein [Candidatus Eisenbacteria bacterium]|nr:CapA family protein [Candidatus Eisenbacteria bacterium]
MGHNVSIFAVGDVFVDRDDPGTAFRISRDVLEQADVVFGNCEGVFSDNWERVPSCGSPVVAPAANAAHLAGAGFTVLSLANNHSVDGGYSAMLDTREGLRAHGAQTVGAGATLAEARAPAVVERNGVRVGFLAYASVFPHGYEARAGTPGLAPLRAHTLYAPWETNEWGPGLMPRVTTVAFEADVRALREDIEGLRRRCDVVVVSCHWGDFTQPYVVTDHERRTAHAAIDAGADAVLGHHHHLLRGVEFHRGRPIFYGLGHYLFDLPNLAERLARDGYLRAAEPAEEIALRRRFGPYRIAPREGYPLLPFHEDSRLTGVAVIRASVDGVQAVGFIPSVIDASNEPVPVPPDSGDGTRVLDYLSRCCQEELFSTRMVPPSSEAGLPELGVQLCPGGS